ncbi:M20 family metallopeptidase [Salisediminibacterium selenitireducens]|uniref:Amidohydrolase n=1 Tax=Bacillus selenitireducens (strain ATCC 700615 / DSM 15326 / MLS10) TaxID=439292 RepID=D6XWE8_BACIE|nr:M20 family metallopeptidase [Salisediminibacterium selenitireducens]ADH97790.1 amidohydrolase [[Bacillus] selenitireducens MLS10]
MNGYTAWINNHFQEKGERWTEVSDHIWANPETRFRETSSSEYLIAQLEKAGFTVDRSVAGMETAFVGETGTGGPVLAFLGEFDALPGLSQRADVAVQEAVDQDGNGHGCGHHLLGTSALAAAVAMKEYLEETGQQGTVRYYGCPAEEGGSGKTFMVREGLFDDVDAAFTWHPASITGVWSFSTLANVQATFRFKGKSAHAAAAPHLGRSALDAVELMNVGVNYLREHIVDDARIHYAITSTGGHSPNVVQAEAEVVHLIRAPLVNDANEIFDRVRDVAKGAALMTGTSVEVLIDKGCSNYIPNHALGQKMGDVIQQFGAPPFSEEEKKQAAVFQEALSPQEIEGERRLLAPFSFALNEPLSTIPIPYTKTDKILPGSTDVGDVSWVTPTVQAVGACFAVGTPLHTWQLVAQGKSAYAHKGMIHVAKILAGTAIATLEDPELLLDAQEELRAFKDGKAYESPIPKEVHVGDIVSRLG